MGLEIMIEFINKCMTEPEIVTKQLIKDLTNGGGRTKVKKICDQI